jgi:protoporphyrin/coproporphyrin ferrochelatase
MKDEWQETLSDSSFVRHPSFVPYDAILLVSFGGPEGPDEVLPFLENVTRGRGIPRSRLLEVAEHYNRFGGISPLNAQIRALLAKLVVELNAHGPHLPVYWGNRNWHPLLRDVVEQMAADGIRRALALLTSAFGSYSSCRQYREDIARARQEVGTRAPQIDVIRRFYNHPGFIETVVDRVRAALGEFPGDRRGGAALIFTAHSIPSAMAESGPYEAQLREACRLVAEAIPHPNWELAFQSRSGSPSQPWLGPDVKSAVRAVAATGGVREVVISPIGFLSDHMEVIFDLDVEIRELCEELKLKMVRAETPGSHPRFVRMIRELIIERTNPGGPRLALGLEGPPPDGPSPLECLPGCCQMAESVARNPVPAGRE